MREQAVDDGAAAVDDVEDALRAAGLFEELAEEDGGEGDFLARLQDEGVAARDRGGIHPERHHRGEVERRDADADAERHVDGVAIDSARDIPQRVAEEECGDAAGVFDVFEAAENGAAGFGVRLAVFA